jgi:hypothetical protein
MASVHDARISSGWLSPAFWRYRAGEKFWLHEPELLAAHEAAIADAVDVGPWYGPVDEAMQRLVEEGSGDPTTFSQLRVKLGLASKEVTPQVRFGIRRALMARPAEMRNGVRDTFYTLGRLLRLLQHNRRVLRDQRPPAQRPRRSTRRLAATCGILLRSRFKLT